MITLLLLIIAIALIVIAVRLRRRRQRRGGMIVKLVAIIVLAMAVFFIVKYQPLPSPSSNRDRKVGSVEPSQMWDGSTARGSKAWFSDSVRRITQRGSASQRSPIRART